MMSLTSLFTVLGCLLATAFLLRRFVLPFLIAAFAHVRVTAFSALSARGIEYRTPSRRSNVVPSLRVERVSWAWGRSQGSDTGLIVLVIGGVSIRADHFPDKTEVKELVDGETVSCL